MAKVSSFLLMVSGSHFEDLKAGGLDHLSGHSLISLTTNVVWWLGTSVLATWASWASTQHDGRISLQRAMCY